MNGVAMSGDLLVPSVMWALHPTFHMDLMRRAAVEGLLPDLLRSLAAGRSAIGAAAPAASVRDGATIVLPVHGILAPRGMYAGGTSYEAISDGVRDAAADKAIGTIVLDVRSPGGTVWGCAEAADAIYAARSEKPVVAVASPYCFSAAYWLATQASAVYATPSGDVGSAGIRTGHVDRSGFEAKVGMKTTLIASSTDKIAGHPHAPLSDDGRAEIQAGVDEANARFTAAIARGRGMRPADVARVHGTGRTFSARRALARGAIDGIATLSDVVGKRAGAGARLDLLRRRAALAAAMADL